MGGKSVSTWIADADLELWRWGVETFVPVFARVNFVFVTLEVT